MKPDDPLRYLLDRLDIQDTIARYARAQDEVQDGEGGESDDPAGELARQWSQVFTEDAVLDYGAAGAPFGKGSYVDLARTMRGTAGQPGVMNGAFSGWAHMLGLPLVEIRGDRAAARTDLLATHVGRPREGRSWHLFDAAVFHDDLVRTAAGWRIQQRRLLVHFVESVATLPPAVAPAAPEAT